jgi:integrase
MSAGVNCEASAEVSSLGIALLVQLAILAGAGLRIGEALALRWRDVDLGTGTIYVRDAKTAKGVRAGVEAARPARAGPARGVRPGPGLGTDGHHRAADTRFVPDRGNKKPR